MGNRLFVGNISFRATPDMIRSEFAEFGEVSDVHLPMDRETGRMRGFAFVTMATDDGAQKAIAGMNNKSLDGRPLALHERVWGSGQTVTDPAHVACAARLRTAFQSPRTAAADEGLQRDLGDYDTAFGVSFREAGEVA